MERRLKDIKPTRRDVLALGGVALAGTWIERLTWPMNVKAAGQGESAWNGAKLHLRRVGRLYQPDGMLGSEADRH